MLMFDINYVNYFFIYVSKMIEMMTLVTKLSFFKINNKLWF